MLFCCLLFFVFFKIAFLWNTTRVSNSLDPDQARRSVGSDLGPNCLQKLAADDTSKQKSISKLLELAYRDLYGYYDRNSCLIVKPV